MAVGRCVFAGPPVRSEQAERTEQDGWFGFAPGRASSVANLEGRRPRRLPSTRPHSPAKANLPVDPTETSLADFQSSSDPTSSEVIRGLDLPPMKWWTNRVSQQILDRERWVRFDLETLLLDTLANSPRILSVGYQTSATFQRIVQQDAAFDSATLLSTDLGATNDPVGNILTTGGQDRLREKSLNFNGGFRRTTRRGTNLELKQQLGFLDSNSSFFIPKDQGNARLSLSLTKPLLSRGGRYYNERLVTQARIESRVAWQDMRGEVENRIADVIVAYWQLHEIRAQLTQQRELLSRGHEIERLLVSRKDFDAALIEITKAKQRVARRGDQVIELDGELQKQQTRLAALVGSDALLGAKADLEMIPAISPLIPDVRWNLRDAVAQALQNRPEIRAATHDVELSALELRVTRVELEPKLNWVFNGYLAQLNPSNRVARSFGQQFENAPGIFSALEFELPVGRRASRAQNREAIWRARQRNESLREAIQQTKFDVETALIDLEQYRKQLATKRNVLSTAMTEENILTVQWRLVGGDDSRVGIKLENLLDSQQRRTDAEQDLVSVEANYMIALVQLQRAMGTLLINEGIQPYQQPCSGEIEFLRDDIEYSSLDGVGEVLADPANMETLESVEIGDDKIEELTPPSENLPPPALLQNQDTKFSLPNDHPPPSWARIELQTTDKTASQELPESQQPAMNGTKKMPDASDQKTTNRWAMPASRLHMPSYAMPHPQTAESRTSQNTWLVPSSGWKR